jgi:hypothetical protein
MTNNPKRGPFPSTTAIGGRGEHIVAEDLRHKGFYYANVNTKGAGSTDIDAFGPNGRTLVQVKTTTGESTPAGLSADEIRNITSRAARQGAQAWAAGVQLDSNGNQVGEITYQKLR